MLARGSELAGDNDELLVECQQDIGIESELFKLECDQEFSQELKDCIDELQRVSRRVLRRASLQPWHRVQVYLRVSHQGSVRVWIQVCLHAEREGGVRVLGNQLRVANRDCERMRVQMVHTSVAFHLSNARANHAVFHTQPAVEREAAKTKQFELWQAVKCGLRIKAWEAREIQLEALGAKRECQSEWEAEAEPNSIGDDAENERDKEVMCAFPQWKASLGSSPWRIRTKRDVRQDSLDKEHIVVVESDAIHRPCSVVSFKTAQRRVVQTISRILCDGCGRSVSAVQGRLCQDAGQLQFKHVCEKWSYQ